MKRHRRTLRTLLTEILSEHPDISAARILELLNKRKMQYSRQRLYQVINKLLAEGVILKHNRTFCLSMLWLENTRAFVERAVLTHVHRLSPPSASRDIARSKRTSKITFKLRSFTETNTQWSRLIMAYARQATDKIVYEWHPHLWFCLFEPAAESSMISLLKRNNLRIEAVCGGQSKLDRKLQEFWRQQGVFVSQHWLAGVSDNYKHYTLIDDVLITLQIPLGIRASMERLFSSDARQEETQPFDLISLASRKVNVSITVERDTKRSKLFRSKFTNFF
jgi:hypothetical protein